MASNSISILLISCIALFIYGWIKLCICDKVKSPQAVAALLMIFGSCTLAGNAILPQVVGNTWHNYGQAAVCFAIVTWIAADRRRL